MKHLQTYENYKKLNSDDLQWFTENYFIIFDLIEDLIIKEFGLDNCDYDINNAEDDAIIITIYDDIINNADVNTEGLYPEDMFDLMLKENKNGEITNKLLDLYNKSKDKIFLKFIKLLGLTDKDIEFLLDNKELGLL